MNFKAIFGLTAVTMILSWRACAQFSYVNNNNGTATITGYAGSGSAVVIPGTLNGLKVIILGDGVHSVFGSGVTSVSIITNITTIATNAFEMASGITNITMGTNVTSIASSAFFYCNSLTSIAIPSSVTNVGTWAFENCYNLASVTISNGLTCIAEGMFDYCPHLTNIVIPNSVTNIGQFAFANDTGLTNIALPNNLAIIGSYAFSSGGLTTVIIPASVTSIGDDAFNSIYSLTSVYFAGNPPSLGSFDFGGEVPTFFYLPGTSGWATIIADRTLAPMVLWNPQAQSGPAFGVQNNQFGFNITGNTNLVVVVEFSTNLLNPVWQSLQTVTLTNGTYYFSDSQWTNSSARFYRFGSP